MFGSTIGVYESFRIINPPRGNGSELLGPCFYFFPLNQITSSTTGNSSSVCFQRACIDRGLGRNLCVGLQQGDHQMFSASEGLRSENDQRAQAVWMSLFVRVPFLCFLVDAERKPPFWGSPKTDTSHFWTHCHERLLHMAGLLGFLKAWAPCH